MAKDLKALLGPYINISKLARDVGISPQGLHQVLDGRFTPSLSIQAAIASCMRLSMQQLDSALRETRKRHGKRTQARGKAVRRSLRKATTASP